MTDKYGAPVISPYFKVVSQCLEQLKFYFSSFGMTPSDRAKMSNQMKIEKEEVKWRTESGKRPWLAGTVKSHMCALLDVDKMSVLLDQDRLHAED